MAARPLESEAYPDGPKHPPIMLKQHDRQAAAQGRESGAIFHRPDAAIRSESVLGLAVFRAGVGVGVFPNFDVAKNFITTDEVHRPDKATHEIYERGYALYRKLYELQYRDARVARHEPHREGVLNADA